MARHDEIVNKALELVRADIALTEKWAREERPGNPFPRGTHYWRLYNASDPMANMEAARRGLNW